MEIIFRKSFQKDFEKLSTKLQSQTEQRTILFSNDPYEPILRLHRLKGEWEGFYSINVSGDLRIIFYFQDNAAIFIQVGTHSQLYD